LYDDIASKQVAAHARSFAPQFQLWSDGAVKQRWVYLPECSVIDTRDMDDWSLPVGARMWKEFAVDGVRIETRLIERVALGAQDFRFTAYLWNDGETDAQRVPDGQLDAKGTTHDVPDEDACRRCHGSHEKGGGRPSRALGLSALQLSHANAGLTLDGLDAEGLLSVPPAASYIVPGNDIERAALGYLHANCGHCHNATADAVPQVDMDLWLRIDQLTVDTTSAYATTVGQPNTIFNDQNVSARIEPGNPQSSAVWYRMNQRGNSAQMPPLASELSDVTGAGAVSAWIASLP
jgi:cytochrome c553